MAKKRVPRIPVIIKEGPRRGRIKYQRKERAEEVMLGSIKFRGYIRCQIVLRLLYADPPNYTSWAGTSLTVDMPDVAKAELFKQKLGDAVYRVAKECGCSMPDVIEAPKEE
jgi:hypothetical protein